MESRYSLFIDYAEGWQKLQDRYAGMKDPLENDENTSPQNKERDTKEGNLLKEKVEETQYRGKYRKTLSCGN